MPSVLLLVTLTFAVYAGSLSHEFLVNWDDPQYVTKNEAVRGFSLEHLRLAFTEFYSGNYAPLQIISYMLDYTLWGLKPAGFILTNILLHSANGVLFYVLLIRLKSSRTMACSAALLFLLHPVQVESVAWISQRKNVLAMTFFLLSFIFYCIYRRKPAKRRSLAYGASVATFFLALMAKSVTVILPPLLLLHDLCYLEKSERRRLWVDKIPFLLAAAGFGVLALVSQSNRLDPGAGITHYHGGNPLFTLFTMLPVLTRYLEMLAWPLSLSALYNPPIKTGVDIEVAASAILLIVLTICGYLLYSRNRRWFFWYACFFLGLLPVSQIVPLVTLMNDRYLYFPMLGVAAMFGNGIHYVLSRTPAARRRIVAAALCIIFSPYPALAVKRAGVWKDTVTLWRDAVAKTPSSAYARENLIQALNLKAADLQQAERNDEALSIYREILVLEPEDQLALNNMSAILMDRGDLKKSRELLEKLIARYPSDSHGWRNLGNNYFLAGDYVRAEFCYLKAVDISPEYTNAILALSEVYLVRRNLEKSAQYLLLAKKKNPADGEVEYGLGRLEAQAGNFSEAVDHLATAVKLGFSGYEQMRDDEYLKPLSGQPGFRAVLQTLSTSMCQ